MPDLIPISPRSRLAALLLGLLCCTLLCGMHRLYVGKLWTGLLWMATVGLLGVGQIRDLVMIVMGEFRDKEGLRVARW